MSQDSDKMKAMLSLKQRIEKRLERLEGETKELKSALEVLNSVLLEKGFKRGNIQDASSKESAERTPASTETSMKEEQASFYQGGEPENVIPLKTSNDDSLAIIYVEKDSVHVVPDESKNFNVNVSPFGNFLVERVLAKMQDKDSELVRMKQLPPEKMFSYQIVRNGDLIREIVVRNVDEERFKELKSSIRWTLEKMYEKMKILQSQ
jgi:hypothetical protein